MRCDGPIPSTRRADAAYCSDSCRAATEKARYCTRNPDYVARQRALVRRLQLANRNPLHKDKFAEARALGFRSMLEVSVARQIESLGYEVQYETMKIEYIKPPGWELMYAD